MTLEGEPASASRARRFLGENLTTWGAPSFEDDARVVITELVTNAVLHARTAVAVSVALGNGRLRIEVRDGSAREPVCRHHSATATTGRGLSLIGQLSDDWGVEPRDNGKVVWAELSQHQAELSQHQLAGQAEGPPR